MALASAPTLALAAPESEQPQPLVAIPSFAPIVEKAEPAVVFIETTVTIKGRQPRPSRNASPEDFFDFFGGPRRDIKVNPQGSGFIFDPEGYIITNNHVIADAEKIMVKLSSGEKIEAEVIGRDPKIDVALIKLAKKGTYPYLNLGDSGRLKTGDWVVAIGNPLGLEHTVTAGIVSGSGRSLGLGPYDDFIQTDAAINSGNSGGPLLNLSGEVIGINAVIATPGGSGGNVGIGFAIPTNLAKGVVAQLKEKGRVVRGWLGVGIQEVTQDLARSFNLGEPRGALVREIVDPDGPAAAAKIQVGDIILKFDGKDIKSPQDLSITVANTEVGKKVKAVIFRDKKEITVEMTVAEQKDDGTFETLAPGGNKLGLTVSEITPEMVTRQNLTEKEGLLISAIESDSPAAESGLRVGDIITQIDGNVVKTIAEYRNIISQRKKGDVLRILVKRGPNPVFYTVVIGD